MNQLYKKLLSGLLVIALLLSSVPLSGFIGMDWASLFPQKAHAANNIASDFDIIEFGYYPQTRVTDSLTISALSKLKKTWTSYGYYSGTGTKDNGNMTAKNFMRYTDVVYRGSKYRGVVFDSYRPRFTGGSPSEENQQEKNGYAANTVYWFKYEPIKWRVIDPDEGLVLSDIVLDSQPFNNYLLKSGSFFSYKYWGNSAQNYYANNYERSSLRQWLNSVFYSTAFSNAQRNLIQYSEIDNSAYSSRYSQFDSDTTTDKIFLLTYDDAVNPSYGFSSNSSESETRRADGSDYAKSQGLWKNDSYPTYLPWKLRSAGERGDYTCIVSSEGGYVRVNEWANDTTDGIRPAMKLDMSSLENVGNGPGSLYITFPAGNDVNPYAGLVVKATGLTNGKVFSRFVSNSSSVSMFGLEETQNYKVELVSQSGVVFGSAENVALDDRYSADISFSNLKPRLTKELVVKDPSGNALTDGYTVQWSLTDSGKLLGSGNTVSDVTTGTALSYEIRLTDAMEAEYLTPAKQEVTITSGGTIECTLQKLAKVTVNGAVTNEDGRPLSGVSVCIEQKINDKISDNTVALTDNDGEFTAEVTDVPLIVTVSKKGYHTLKWTGTADQIDSFSLTELTGIRISLDLTKTAVGAEPQSMLYDEMDLVFTVTVDEETVDGVVYDHPDLVFPEGSISNGSTAVITARDRGGDYLSEPVTFTYDETGTDPVPLELIEKGRISVQADDLANEENMLLLFDSGDNFVASYFSAGQTFESAPLEEGTYTAVVLGKSDILSSLPKSSLLAGFGLSAGTDYYTSSVTVQNGSEAVLSGFSIPHLDEASLYQTDSNQTSFRINPSSSCVGQNLLLRCAYGFAADREVSNASVIITLPEQCSLVLNSLTLNGYCTASYEKSGNTLTVPTIGSSGVVRLYVRPKSTNDGKPLSFAASLSCKLDGAQYRQPIGTAQAVVKDVEWTLPETAVDTQVAVSGQTAANAKVELYDNDVLAGTAAANASGGFTLKFDLIKPYSYSIHDIYIVVTLPDGDSYQSEKKQLVYNKDGIALKKVTMLNTGDNGPNVTVFDYLNPSSSVPKYRMWPSRYPTFTFKVEFTTNDPEKITDVYVVTTNGAGQKTYVPVYYNESLGCWVGTHDYDKGSDAPRDVNVSYECISNNSKPFPYYKLDEFFDAFYEFEEELIEEATPFLSVDDEECADESFSLKLKIEDYEFAEMRVSLLEYDSFSIADWEDHYVECEYEEEDEDKTAYIYSNRDDLTDSYYFAVPETETYYKIELVYNNAMDNNKTVKPSKKGSDWAEIAELIPGFGGKLAKLINWSGKVGKLIYKINSYASILREANESLLQLINAKCPNGEYKLSEEERWLALEFVNTTKLSIDDYQRGMIAKLTAIAAGDLAMFFALGKAQKVLGRLSLNGTFPNFDLQKKWANVYKSMHGMKSNAFVNKLQGNIITNWTNNTYQFYGQALTYGAYENFPLLKSLGAIDLLEMVEEEIAAGYTRLNERISNYRQELINILKDRKCNPEQPPTLPTPPKGGQPAKDIQDPSGFVCEAVASNRLEGVTVTCYYSPFSDGAEAVVWNAEEYDQQNPLITDANGHYEWFVPEGWWQVRYEKDGYVTGVSDWLPVPPPQTEVNYAMTSTELPQISTIHAYPDGVEIRFSQYMDLTTVTEDNITVTVGGEPLIGTIEPVNAEEGFNNSFVQYASVFRFVPEDEETVLSGDVSVSASGLKNYAGTEMENDVSQTVSVEPGVAGVSVEQDVALDLNQSYTLTFSILPAAAGAGKTIRFESENPSIVSVSAASAVANASGQASVTVKGELPGATVLNYRVDGTDFAGKIMIAVDSESDFCKPVTASLASGSTVDEGTTVTLTTPTNGAKIYYTTDGTCPCIEDGSRTLYTEPIVLTESVRLIAYAVKDGLYDSGTTMLKYTVIPANVTVQWFANDDLYQEQIIPKGTPFTPPESPEKEGYEFLGWSESADAETPTYTPESSITVTTSKRFYAVWKKLPSPSSVALDKGSLLLPMGETATLTATVTPDISIVWSSSDSSVATVDGGILTPVAPGTATVTVSTNDEDYYVSTDSCTVHVPGIKSAPGKSIVIEPNCMVSGLAPHMSSIYDYVAAEDNCILACGSGAIGTGKTLYVLRDDKLVCTYTVVIFGDIDGDGWYNGTDAFYVSLISNGMIPDSTLSAAQRTAADCNHDGLIDEADVVLLEQAGLLLSQVDQTMPNEELQNNSAYLKYCGLIDQSTEITGPDQPADAEEPAEQPDQTASSAWQIIIDLFKRLVNFITMLFSIVVMPK